MSGPSGLPVDNQSAIARTRVHTDLLIALVWADAGGAELQSRLRDLGYYNDIIDGCPRSETVVAIAKFQRDRGLPVTGYPDARTVQALRACYPF